MLSHVRLFATPWTVAHRPLLSMDFPRQEYWSGLPFPSLGRLLNPRIEPVSPALAGRFFTTEPPGKPRSIIMPTLVIMPLIISTLWLCWVPGDIIADWRHKEQEIVGLKFQFCLQLSSSNFRSNFHSVPPILFVFIILFSTLTEFESILRYQCLLIKDADCAASVPGFKAWLYVTNSSKSWSSHLQKRDSNTLLKK